jgi:hypothetical protein
LASQVVVFTPRGELVLTDVVRNTTDGAIKRGWVVNGAWTFEVKGDEHLAKDGASIVNRWPAEGPMREIVVPDKMDGDYNSVIEWARNQMNYKEENLHRVILTLENDGKLHSYAQGDGKTFATHVFRAFESACRVEGVINSMLPELPKTQALVHLWEVWRTDLDHSSYRHYLLKLADLPPPAKSAPQPQPQPQPEPPMNNIDKSIPVQHITLVFGNDVKDMTEAELISTIKKIEAERDSLNAVKTPSKKVDAKVEECNKLLTQLAELLDAK